MKLYLDVCCYNRPFDDLSDDRVRMEAEAVSVILDRCEHGLYELVSSDIIEYEISKIINQDKRDAVSRSAQIAKRTVKINNEIKSRAYDFEKSKIKPFDALHLGFAQVAGIDLFLTTDDRIIKKKDSLNITFRILNPLDFIHEELFNE